VVFGVVNPAGRSPQTYYSDDSELPKLGNMDLYAGNGTTYRYYSGKPTVPFGFGLSYTTFKYADLKLSATSIGHCDTVYATVTVTNTGGVDGDEVVQVYVKTTSDTVAPRVRLADFVRVHIAKGASATVTLEITPKYHSVVKDDPSGKNFWTPAIAVEAGLFTVHVGPGQPDFNKGGVLDGSVTVATGGALTTEYKCAALV
jgi:beta-glucosidase